MWGNYALVEFARHSLKPTVFADLAWNDVFEALKPKLGEERARVVVGELSLGAAPPESANLPGGIRDLAAGRITRAEFLESFGHRGTNEMELAQPRWSEAPQELDKLVRGATGRERIPRVLANEDYFEKPGLVQFPAPTSS